MAVINCIILTQEKVVKTTAVIYCSIFITLAPTSTLPLLVLKYFFLGWVTNPGSFGCSIRNDIQNENYISEFYKHKCAMFLSRAMLYQAGPLIIFCKSFHLDLS